MIQIDVCSHQPIYIQIYEQYKHKILTGVMVEGEMLPSTRYLARDLKIGRNTVENAYAQLVSEGYVKSRPGSGYSVLKISVQSPSPPIVLKDKPSSVLMEEAPFRYNFLYGSMSQAPFPRTSWRRALLNADAKLSTQFYTSYGHQQGEQTLRALLCDYLLRYRGLTVQAEQLLVCAGVEYAITLLCQLLKRMGIERVAMEEPGYKGARDFFIHHGFDIVPIPVLEDGLDIDALRRSKARVVYVTPSHQFPTGAVMPIQKRQALLDWAKQNGAFIIEDDYDSELRYGTRPIPSIGSIEGCSQVIYIGTFSKALSPSLRVSYMALPPALMTCYAQHFVMYQCSVSLLIQETLTELIKNGHYETHLRKLNVINKRKHSKMIAAIKRYLGDQVRIHDGQGGIHILLELRNGLLENELIEKAKKSGIILMPASPFWYGTLESATAKVILAFGNIKEEDIEAGIAELAKAWKCEVRLD